MNHRGARLYKRNYYSPRVSIPALCALLLAVRDVRDAEWRRGGCTLAPKGSARRRLSHWCNTERTKAQKRARMISRLASVASRMGKENIRVGGQLYRPPA